MKLDYIIKHPHCIAGVIATWLSPVLSDKVYLSILYYGIFGRLIKWNNPKTLNEKIQWLKLYNRNPLYSKLVDKYEVKSFVAQKIGGDHVIETLGVWDDVDQINFDTLPSQFVLKTTHDGGGKGIVVCKDKATLNIEKAKQVLKESLYRDSSNVSREWVYRSVNRRIIAERYMEDKTTHDLPDYKFFVFNGKVKALFIATERGTGDVKFDFYDENFNHLDIVQTHPMSGKAINKPKTFELMKRLAETLCHDMPFVRCDFYEVDGKVYFGEFTFFHHGGFVPFHPSEWDEKFGNWITLPNKMLYETS